MDLSKESTFLLALCFADLMNDQADATLGNDVRNAIAKLDEPHQCLSIDFHSSASTFASRLH